ncbi:MAG: hypothetical protein M1825_002108 [Sarcosagium campestre]|nr:MAG: hypothetical protein M1825_002108 [Sarcosagium campestre]
MAGDGSPNDIHFPSPADAGSSIAVGGFRITTRKLPILKAGPIESMTASLGITPPEMIFGDNRVSIEHQSSGWRVEFNAHDALDRVDKTGSAMLKVAYSKEWQKNREKVHEGIKEVVKPFDWSYTTDYKGTVPKDAAYEFEPSAKAIPLELLKRPDPILFFDEVMLYEDELADNGIAMYSCKIRVMPERLLLLCRFFMRLDNVLFRIRDTRIYVEFKAGEIIREYVAREESFDVVKQKLAITREDVPALMRDANKLSELLPVTDRTIEIPYHGFQKRLLAMQSLAEAAISPSVAKKTKNPIPRPSSTQTKIPNAPTKSSDKLAASPSASTTPSSNDIYTDQSTSPTAGIAKSLRHVGSVTETYAAFGVTEQLYHDCGSQAEYTMPKDVEARKKTSTGVEIGEPSDTWWYKTLNLTPTFNTWAQITMLHVWLLSARFRCLGASHAPTWQQHLLDHFFHDAEERMMVRHGMVSRMTVSRYLKDLHQQYRGAVVGYDEGLCRGDAVLAAALWRNVWGADPNVDVRSLAGVTAYVRRSVAELDAASDEHVMMGKVRFVPPLPLGPLEIEQPLREEDESPSLPSSSSSSSSSPPATAAAAEQREVNAPLQTV